MNKAVMVWLAALLSVGVTSKAEAKTNAGGKSAKFDDYWEIKLNEDGWQANSDGWLIRIDRNRVFNEFKLTCPVSTEKWPSGTKEKEKLNDDEGLLPFENARVRSLKIDGNAVCNKLRKLKFETISLRGVQELSQIRIFGKIPEFEENKKWLGLAKDGDWRKNLKRIEFVDRVEGLESISFIGEVKCVALGTNTTEEVKHLWRDVKRAPLSTCYALEQLEVPYSMATNLTIQWGAIIRNSPLKNTEVVSFEQEGEDGKRNAVLLNIAESGEVSDYVTVIRKDAIPENFGREVCLPFRAKTVIGGRLNPKLSLSLKRNALLFYPDLADRKTVRQLRKSRGVIAEIPVSVTTAYEGLVLSNSVGTVSDTFQAAGDAFKSSIQLRRGRNLENRITVGIRLGNETYPVSMTPTKGTAVDSLSVVFAYGASDWRKMLGMGLAIVVITAFLLGVMVVWAVKTNRFFSKKCWVAALGIFVGVMIIALGMDDVGVLQYYVDTYLTGTVMSYLNASFISSLVISVSSTLVKLAVGFLQGINISVVFASYDLNSLLQPVQDVLDKIETYSWISTCVLAFVRMFCQILKDGAGFVWGALGSSLVVFSFLHFMGSRTLKRWVGFVLSVTLFLALGLPFILSGCAWFSYQLSGIAGSAFQEAMADFAALAHSFTFDSLKSMAAIKGLMSQVVDAVSNLTSASMFFIATKAFDCFLVPLLLYFGFKKVLKGFSDKKDSALMQIRDLLAQRNRSGSESVRMQDYEKLITDKPTVAPSEETRGESLPVCVSEDAHGQSALQLRLGRFVARLKPEWITAGCAVMICLLVAVSSLLSHPEVVVVSGGGNAVAAERQETMQDGRRVVVADDGAAQWIWGGLLGVLALLAFWRFDRWCYQKARHVCEETQDDEVVKSASDKLKMLNEQSYWFDLPLYGGLGGTVLGFLIISIPGLQFLESIGRMVAYGSTLLGIGFTWWIQKKVISPCKTELMHKKVQDEAARHE